MDKKNYKWLILLLFVLFWIFYFIYDYNRSLYYNNYYEINKVNLNKIIDYIEDNNLDWHIYMDSPLNDELKN